MAWDITAEGSTHSIRLAHAALRQQFSVTWKGPGEVYIAALNYRAGAPDLPGCEWPHVAAPLVPTILSGGQKQFIEFVFPLHNSFLRAVEDWRKGQPHPLRIDVRATVVWCGQQDGRAQASQQEELFSTICIGRDHWLSLLSALGWDEFETFEVPVRAPKQHESLRQGLAHLRAAHTAFQLGQWAAAATDARKAIEAAASATSDESNRKERIEALVSSVVQGPGNQAKRETLSGLMFALKKLRDEATHGGNLGCQVHREDAELALTVAVSIFRYMGESLARLEGRRT